MSAITIGIIAFFCVFGGTIIGLLIRSRLPEHHLTDDSKDAVKMGIGLLATLSALVLGLLISSARDSFDQMSDAVTQSSAKLIMLDRTMARYGSETGPIREILRNSVIARINRVWTKQKADANSTSVKNNKPNTMELVSDKLAELTPQTDSQRAFKSDALQLCKEMQQERWLMLEQAQTSLPTTLIVVLLFWLTVLFCSMGLLAPANKTVIGILIVCAISVGAAIFLVEELDKPFSGVVKISNAPLIKALEKMSK